MASQNKQVSPLHLSRLTWGEAEKEINRSGAIILPLGGCEPYGSSGTFGVASACAEYLADALSQKMGLLCAPVLSFGCSTPFSSFGGTAGCKPRTLSNIFCESLRQWFRQGIRSVIAIDALMENGEALALACRRLKISHPGQTVLLFSLQRDPRIRKFIAEHSPFQEPGRTEYGMLSMAAWINPDLVRETGKSGMPAARPDAQRYRQWHKRGADPEQFRKLFPDGSSSNITSGFDASFGMRLCGYILQVLEQDAAGLFITTETNRNNHAPSKHCRKNIRQWPQDNLS